VSIILKIYFIAYAEKNLGTFVTSNYRQVMASSKVPKSSCKFYCDSCDYNTARKSQYARHLSTSKHQKRENASKMLGNASENVPKSSKQFECSCGKIYKHDSSYYKHKKTCKNASTQHEMVFNKDFVMMVLKQNSEVLKANQEVLKENSELKNIIVDTQNQMMEVIKNGTHNTTTNSHNKTFNLQFFLNETCKDAMNITDFVNSIQLQLTDLVNMGDVGYINGMSNIIIKNLKDLDVHVRPVHCTDIKREILYVKDENTWNKETDGNPKIRCAIKRIAQKNSKQLFEFKDKYPDCVKSHSKHSDTYNNLLIESMGGKGDNDIEKENKIIKKVAKEIVVDK
jgi:hypothetical protein